MEDSRARLRVNRTEQEVEIAGTEDFVREFAGKLDELLVESGSSPTSTRSNEEAKPPKPPAPNGAQDVPPTFGAYLHKFPDSITNNDRMLIAGHFAQTQSDDDSFKTRATNDLLVGQGVKLSNAAMAVRRNRDAKRVFNLAKGQFRVSKTGKQYLEELMTPAE